MSEVPNLTAAIFRRGGQKEQFGGVNTSNGSSVKLDELEKVWAAPRVGRSLAGALWLPEHGVAKVLQERSKPLAHMGFHWNKKLHIHPEEAVYLLDRANCLLVVDNQQKQRRLLSLQEAYSLMMQTVPIEHYLVYAHLMRAGFIVRRSPALWTVPPTADISTLWPSFMSEESATCASSLPSASQHPASVASESSPHPSTSSRPAVTARQQTPPAELATHNGDLLQPADCQRTSTGHAAMQGQEAGAAAHAPTEPSVGKKRPRHTLPSNAGEPKRQKGQISMRQWWGCPGEGHPWLDAMSIAEEPRCAVSAAAEASLLERCPRLRPCPRIVLPDMPAGASQAAIPAFDVFKGNSKFSRKQPDPAIFRIHMCGTAPPGLQDIHAADAARADNLPVVFATLNNGDISLFAMPIDPLPQLS